MSFRCVAANDEHEPRVFNVADGARISAVTNGAKQTLCRWPLERLNLQNVAIFRPNVETASHAAIRADSLGATDAPLSHARFGFGELQNRAVARFWFDALHYIDHAAQCGLRERCEKSCMPQHGFFHERIARAHGNAVPAGDTTRFSNG